MEYTYFPFSGFYDRCNCSYDLFFDQNFQAYGEPFLLYNPTYGTTYTYDLRYYECLYPEADCCCPIYFTVSDGNPIVIPQPLYGVPRGIGPYAGGPPQAPQAAPPQAPFHAPQDTHPLFRPVASTIPGFTAFGRKAEA